MKRGATGSGADKAKGREAVRRRNSIVELIQLRGWCGAKKSARKDTWNSGTPHGSFLIIMPAHRSVKRFDAGFILKVLSPEL